MVRPVDGGSVPLQNSATDFTGEIQLAAVKHTPRRDPGDEGIDSGIGTNPELSRGSRDEDPKTRAGLSEAYPSWTQDGDFIYPPDNGVIYK
jgi:hypothetical protein